MYNKLVCADDAEDLINDINLFISGPEDEDVVLSDSSVIESYRKYAISDMTRTGNSMQLRLYFKDDIISYNDDIYVCLADNEVTTLASINPTFWQKVGNFDTVVGNGISAYLAYDKANNKILFSQGILSVVKSTVDSSLITVVLSEATTGKIGAIFGADIRNIDYSKLLDSSLNTNNSYTSGFYQKTVVGRVISNDADTIEIGINQGAYYIDLYAGNINNLTILNPTDRDVFNPIIFIAFIAY